MTDDAIGTVAIIGLGLIGGSLARDLAAAGVRTVGYDRDARTLSAALEEHVIAAPLGASLRGLEEADVVVLAVPVSAAADLLPSVAARATRARLLTDVGSTKTGTEDAALRCGAAARFVGAHPLAGDDRSGWIASRPGLFAGARVFVCPAPGSDPQAVRTAERLWHTVGAYPERIDARTHDRELAWASHLPQVLASALAGTLADAGVRPGDLGAGGRGMTRLAASSPDMWADIALENRALLAPAIAALDDALGRTRVMLERGDRSDLQRFFAASRAWAAPLTPAEVAVEPIVDESSTSGVVVVAFQGELGAHSEECVRAFFPAPVSPLPCRTFQDVGRAVHDGRAAFGLLPVENSSAGSVVAAYEVLARSDLAVLAEVVRPIRHALLGVPGAAPGRVRRVLSHPVALAQCSSFLDERRWIEAVAFYDTAGAAKEVARSGDPALAAVAAPGAASRYGLDVLAADIQDRSDNRTRFVVVAGPAAHGAVPAGRRSGRMKSALLIDVANTPGALSSALAPFARRGVNLTHIQSTPGGAPWTYRFIIELDADAVNSAAADAIAELRAVGMHVRVLGSYPAVVGA